MDIAAGLAFPLTPMVFDCRMMSSNIGNIWRIGCRWYLAHRPYTLLVIPKYATCRSSYEEQYNVSLRKTRNCYRSAWVTADINIANMVLAGKAMHRRANSRVTRIYMRVTDQLGIQVDMMLSLVTVTPQVTKAIMGDKRFKARLLRWYYAGAGYNIGAAYQQLINKPLIVTDGLTTGGELFADGIR